MRHIAICDDMPQELDKLNVLLTKYSGEHKWHDIKLYLFSSPLDLLAHISEKGGFDVVFLDIYMPGIMGTEIARELRAMGDLCQIIFLTTSREHAVDAFSLNALHYLVKPYSEQDLFLVLDKLMGILEKEDAVYLTIKSIEGIRRVDLNKLIYAETSNQMQQIWFINGESIYVRKSSTEFFEMLKDEPRFYKCGSTYIFNMDYIIELTSKNVTFSTGVKIPLLTRKYSELKKTYMDYSCQL